MKVILEICVSFGSLIILLMGLAFLVRASNRIASLVLPTVAKR